MVRFYWALAAIAVLALLCLVVIGTGLANAGGNKPSPYIINIVPGPWMMCGKKEEIALMVKPGDQLLIRGLMSPYDWPISIYTDPRSRKFLVIVVMADGSSCVTALGTDLEIMKIGAPI